MIDDLALEARIDAVEERIAEALRRAGRTRAELTVVSVSKSKDSALMNRLGQLLRARDLPVIYGENYVQEFREKIGQLSGAFEAHLIGPLQSNKAKEAVRLFSMIESVHSADIAREINKRAATAEKRQAILLQVNISADESKSGFTPAAALQFIARELGPLANLELHGFMTITALYENPEHARKDFAALRRFRDQVRADTGIQDLRLSMGMSADFDVAIEEGADYVRIGTALFGER